MSARDEKGPAPGAIAIAAVLGLSAAAVLWAWLALGAPETGAGGGPPGQPGGEARPFEESRSAAELAARKRAWLSSFGWVDREKEIARIPIERAFDILIERAAKAAKEREEEAKEDAAQEKKEPGK
jgi:hypothetical protein